jgi:hypothetical protein
VLASTPIRRAASFCDSPNDMRWRTSSWATFCAVEICPAEICSW